MATVIAQPVGGAKKLVEAETISHFRTQLSLGVNYKVFVNGVPASDDTVLEDGNMVTYAESQKGA